MSTYYMNNLYICNDCSIIASLWGMNKRCQGGYDCPLCSGNIRLEAMVSVEDFYGCLNIVGKEKLEC